MIDDCQELRKGIFLLSKIMATRVAIQHLYNKHTVNVPINSENGIGLIFLDTMIAEIVDLDKLSLKKDLIRSLEFENNTFLKLGLKTSSARLRNVRSTIFRYNGVFSLQDNMFHSDTVIFSNFSASLSNLMTQKANSNIEPWSGFTLRDLVLENSFSDFSTFIGFRMTTIKIKNVNSINSKELMPRNFLMDSDLLQNISIINSYHVTLPQFFFDRLFQLPSEINYKLWIEMDIWNVQQHSIGKREKLNSLEKLNQVPVNDELRDILAATNDPYKCSDFCRIDNEKSMKCIELSEKEKRACGICVKNIIGDNNLTEVLNQVCKIEPSSTSQTTKTEATLTELLPIPTTNSDKSEMPKLVTTSVKNVVSTYTTASTGNLSTTSINETLDASGNNFINLKHQTINFCSQSSTRQISCVDLICPWSRLKFKAKVTWEQKQSNL